jgi:hypothetical protein
LIICGYPVNPTRRVGSKRGAREWKRWAPKGGSF